MAPAPAPTVACGHAIQPPPHTSGAHRPLLSALLSISTRATPTISRSGSPPEPTPSLAPSSGPKVQLQQLEASYVSKVSTRLKEFVNNPPSLLHHPDSTISTLSGLKGARHILRGASVVSNSVNNKRSPSPPISPKHIFYNELSNEVKAFSGILNLFVKDIAGLDLSKASPESHCLMDDDGRKSCVFCNFGFLRNLIDDDDEEEDLVRDAMNEALEALSAFQIVLLGLSLHPSKLLSTLKNQNQQPSSTCSTLKNAIEEIPSVILLHCISSRIEGFQNCLPHLVWGLSWDEYESGLLKGFSSAEVWCKTSLTKRNQ